MATEKRPITIEDLTRLIDLEDPQVSPDGQWIATVQVTISEFENTYKRTLWLNSTSSDERYQITQSGKDSAPRFSPDGSQLAFVSARNDKPQIYLLSLRAPGGEPRQLTTLSTGASSPEWSPDGGQIAFISRLSADERLHEGEEKASPSDELAAKHEKERREQDEKMRFDPRHVWRIPYRQGTSYVDDRYAHLYVIDTTEGEDVKPVRLTDGEIDHSPPQWSKDGDYLYTTRTTDPLGDEPWTTQGIYRIAIADQASELLTTKEFTYFGVLISPDGNWLATSRGPRKNLTRYISRLSLLNTSDGELIDITTRMDREPDSWDWAPDGRLFFSAGDQGNMEIYVTEPGSETIDKVVAGTIEVQNFSAGPNGIAYIATTPLSPQELYWLPDGSEEAVRKTAENDSFLKEVIVQETHELRWQAPDGLEIQGWYILPVGYEEGKKYPLAFNIHGGPHVMWSPAAKSMWHEWQTHAASGYAVFYCNPRGAEGYGQEHHDGIAARWGEADLPDLMSGIDALIDLGFVDEERMAVTGGSYGGFMTGWIVTHTDRFRAAVSQRGVYNLSSFYGTSDVPVLISSEFGVEPWEDQALLWAYSPVAHAHHVKTPLLMIHAENDFRVPIEQAEQFFAFIRRSTDTPVELWRYPRDGHELSRSGEPKHRISRLTKMVDFFNRYCQSQG